MGRNARKRAEEREEHRNHGAAGEEPEQALERPEKCPRCGSTDPVVAPYMARVTSGVEIICGHCNWQGMIRPGIWQLPSRRTLQVDRHSARSPPTQDLL